GGGRHRADHPESIPGRHVDADGRLSRAVLHLPRTGAGRNRLAVSARPVPPASDASGARRATGGITRVAGLGCGLPGLPGFTRPTRILLSNHGLSLGSTRTFYNHG